MNASLPELAQAQPTAEELLVENRRLREKLAALEKERKLQRERNDILSQVIRIGYWEWDEVTGKPLSFTEEFATILGLGLAELTELYHEEEDLYAFIHPEDLEHYQEQVNAPVSEKLDDSDYNIFDYRIVRPDGEVRYVREIEYGVVEEDGQILRSFGAVLDITDYQQALIDLDRSKARFSSLIAQLPIGVQEQDYSAVKRAVDELIASGVSDIRAYLESNGEFVKNLIDQVPIIAANDTLLKFYGAETFEEYNASEEDIDDWWTDEWVRFYASEINGLLNPESVHYWELDETRVDGTPFETRMMTRVVRGCEQTWQRVITLHEDITERKQYERALEEAKVRAEAASQAKSRFLSSMSHELRTPLNAILGFSEMFRFAHNLDDRQRDSIGKINQAGTHLLTLIEEILELSRIESGTLKLDIGPVVLGEVLEDSVTWVSEQAKSRNVEICFDRSLIGPLAVRADALKLKQILLNLLSNAVKYNNPGGSIQVLIATRPNNRIGIGISDTGPGIAEDQLAQLFQPFNRLGKESSAIEGTGIGLVITQQLLEMMDGEIEVESTPGKGSTFWATLPVAAAAVREAAPECKADEAPEPVLEQSRGGTGRVLVAEDMPINSEILAAQLEMLGYEVDVVENGADALETWLRKEHCVLLTDIRMPVMDGHELTRRIRELEQDGDEPAAIIAVTANAMEEDTEACIAAGVSDIITKPVKMDELKRVMAKWG